MSETNNDPPYQLMCLIEERLSHVSRDQIVSWLQITVERLSFSAETDRGPQSVTISIARQVLQGDVGEDFLSVLDVASDRGLLSILIGPAGRAFLAYSMNYYNHTQELACVTAVGISPDFKEEVTQVLRTKYPHPTRIVFDVVPNLISGITLSLNGSLVVDLSLRTAMNKQIPAYIRRETIAEMERVNNVS